MTSAEPVPPPALRPREVQASVLAAFQLVEDAHYLRTPRRSRQDRNRVAAERAVASRRLGPELPVG